MVDYPDVSDVRAGVEYKDGELVGTLAVPSATILTGSAAAGPALVLAEMETLLANCPAFQTWVGAASAAAAAESIHWGRTVSTTRPLVVIQDEDVGANRIGMSAYGHEGRLSLQFEGEIAEADREDAKAARYGFDNALGAILANLEALAGTDAFLSMASWRFSQLPVRGSEEEEADGNYYYLGDIEVTWG